MPAGLFSETFLIAFGLVVALLFIILLVTSRVRRAGPNEAMIITSGGRRIGDGKDVRLRIVKGGWGWS